MATFDDAQLARIWQVPPGFIGRLAAVNNQVIGKRFMITAAIFFLLAGVMALLMRVQLAVPENDFLGPTIYNQLFTMHGSTMMFLFIVPFLEGMAVYLLPLMIGSRDLAFPRLSAFGYWTYLFGGLLLFSSFAIGQVPDAGWFAYTPLSNATYSGLGIDVWLLGLALVEIGGIAAAAELVVTILKLRAPGMALTDMPIFAWSWLVTGVMILFAFTTLLIATFMLELDRSAGTNFFDPTAGGSSLLWQHLFWFFGHPEVYIMFLPAVGMVSMIVPTFARRPIAGYSLVVVAIVVMGFISFGLWAHHMFTTGIPWLSLAFFTAASLAIALTTGTQIFAWIATLWGTRPVLSVPLLYVIGFVLIFVVGGMTGVMVAVVPFDLQVHDTYFVVAHFHYVLIGGVVFPILAGLHYWLPKITGRMPGERLGRWSFWLIFIGFNVTFFPMHILGFQGMPRRVYTYPADIGLDLNNMIATAGTFVLMAGLALFTIDVVLSLWRGRPAEANPWGAGTLEWSVPSPPGVYNYFAIPVVAGREPLWGDQPLDAGPETHLRLARTLTGGGAGFRVTAATTVVSGEPQAVQLLPGPTHWPLLVTLGLSVGLIGALFKFYLVTGLGLVFALGCLVAWLWPDRAELEAVRARHLELDAGLPVIPTGSASVVWWGMICLVTVIVTIFGALFYSYFYLWLYAEAWPQGGLPRPAVLWPGLAYGALVASAAPAWLARRAFLAGSYGPARWALVGVMALGLVFLGLHIAHLAGLGYGPQANAYASAVWVLSLGADAIALVGVALAGALLLRLEPEPGILAGLVTVQFQITFLFWIAVVVLGACVYGTVHLSPYVIR